MIYDSSESLSVDLSKENKNIHKHTHNLLKGLSQHIFHFQLMNQCYKNRCYSKWKEEWKSTGNVWAIEFNDNTQVRLKLSFNHRYHHLIFFYLRGLCLWLSNNCLLLFTYLLLYSINWTIKPDRNHEEKHVFCFQAHVIHMYTSPLTSVSEIRFDFDIEKLDQHKRLREKRRRRKDYLIWIKQDKAWWVTNSKRFSLIRIKLLVWQSIMFILKKCEAVTIDNQNKTETITLK